MLDRQRVGEFSVVIEDDRAGQVEQAIDETGKLPPIGLQIDVPSQRRDARGDRFERLPGQDTGGHFEPDAAHAASAEPCQFRVVRVRIDDGDAARLVFAKRLERGHEIRIVGAMRHRLDHDGARQSEPLLYGSTVIRHRRYRRRIRRIGARGKARLEDVHVAVARTGGRAQFRRGNKSRCGFIHWGRLPSAVRSNAARAGPCSGACAAQCQDSFGTTGTIFVGLICACDT